MSENRTDFDDVDEMLLPFPRNDFLSREDDDATRGREEALAKSAEREGSLGCEMVLDVVEVG